MQLRLVVQKKNNQEKSKELIIFYKKNNILYLFLRNLGFFATFAGKVQYKSQAAENQASCPPQQPASPHPFISVIPLAVLIALIVLVVKLFPDDALAGKIRTLEIRELHDG